MWLLLLLLFKTVTVTVTNINVGDSNCRTLVIGAFLRKMALNKDITLAMLLEYSTAAALRRFGTASKCDFVTGLQLQRLYEINCEISFFTIVVARLHRPTGYPTNNEQRAKPPHSPTAIEIRDKRELLVLLR
jgi:hypothetical protein